MRLISYLQEMRAELEHLDIVGSVIIGYTTPDRHGIERWKDKMLVALVLPASIPIDELSATVDLSVLCYFFDNNPETATIKRLNYADQIIKRLNRCLHFVDYQDITLEHISTDIKDGVRYMGESDNVINISSPLHAISLVYRIRLNSLNL